ncbi:mitochondrial outer membrane protein porin 3 [Physcomitrium patens]|uniref:Uncharacterized protein n=1 Tax=Physcomitrium patens TaxID=3218 RepID=A9SD20_PHYPA|nr:mitochondrial outer membrane porin-like [Physcomitrium patens]XP_024387260.1 mitochondrial outer membrane porin-like [Physcomitrium patens]PNR46958.1 hypothetical protein PHYPA_014078 [Physcomitrium patens]|eukprot:XP_024387259.1 mitochondrial outer membrane porin-like [Physcomitrella patens]
MTNGQKEPLLARIGGPTLFQDVGKQAKDLVTKGFVGGHTLMVSCIGPRGATFTTTATIVQDITVGIVQANFLEGNTTHNLSFATTGNQIQAQSTISNFGVSGLTAGVQTSFPNGENGKAHITYSHDFAALHAKIHGFKAAPDLELSANLGNKKLFAGGSLLYNTDSRNINMTRAGIGYATEEFTGSLIVDPLIEKSFDLYLTRQLSPRCQVGTHISRLYEKGLTAARVAGSYVYNGQTTLKGRFDDKGLVAGLLQFSPNPLVTFSLLAEVNSRDLKAQPNVGLSLSFLAT